MVAETKIGTTQLGTGAVVQVVNALNATYGQGTTTVPLDDSIMQKTEGDEYFSVSITPKSATNKLLIQVVMVCSTSTPCWCCIGLFQDTTAGALSSVFGADPHGNVIFTIPLTHFMTAGTISATTFKIRAGLDRAGTFCSNGYNGNRYGGGVMASSITITEIAV